MEEKILSISIAAYNVSKYLDQTIQSLLGDPSIIGMLDIMIVNDGSSDNTLEIAKKYADSYPDSIRVFDKENGGYGSTVNIGIREAKGKYFKILDGDDWFEINGLGKMIHYLKNTDVDCVVNRMYQVRDGNDELELIDVPWAEYENNILKTEEVNCNAWIAMWHLIVRTELIQKDQYLLPEHCLYTDQLFTVNALTRVKTIYFCNTSVYCYRIGRDGQSVSKENRIKHYQECIKVFIRQLDIYESSYYINNLNRNMLISRISRYYILLIKTLLLVPKSKSIKKELIEIEKLTKQKAEDIYKTAGKQSKKVALLRMTNYIVYGFFGGKEKNWN